MSEARKRKLSHFSSSIFADSTNTKQFVSKPIARTSSVGTISAQNKSISTIPSQRHRPNCNKSKIFKGPKTQTRTPNKMIPKDHNEVINPVETKVYRSKSIPLLEFKPQYDEKSSWQRKAEEFHGGPVAKRDVEKMISQVVKHCNYRDQPNVSTTAALTARERKENDYNSDIFSCDKPKHKFSNSQRGSNQVGMRQGMYFQDARSEVPAKYRNSTPDSIYQKSNGKIRRNLSTSEWINRNDEDAQLRYQNKWYSDLFGRQVDYEKWKSESRFKRNDENDHTNQSLTSRPSYGRIERISCCDRLENPRTLTPPPAPLPLGNWNRTAELYEPDTTTYQVTGLDQSTTQSSIKNICPGLHIVSAKPEVNLSNGNCNGRAAVTVRGNNNSNFRHCLLKRGLKVERVNRFRPVLRSRR